METNQKKSLVAFYLSKYNEHAIKQLGYDRITEALDDLSIRLRGEGEINSYIKRRRDEFDVFFENGRKGYNKRKPALGVKDLFELWNPLSFEELTELVQMVLGDGLDGEDKYNDIDEEISDYNIENYLNYSDESATVNEKYKKVLERRYSKKHIDMLKKLYNYKCQICGCNCGEKYGERIAEAHHINYFSKSKDNSSKNIIILCPNHHRIIHKLNPSFDRDKLEFVYGNGTIDKIQTDCHLEEDKREN